MATSQGTKNKRNGTRFESDVVKLFRSLGVEADRLRLSGTTDEGDVLVRLNDGRRIVIEAKSGQNWRPKEWLREAEQEAINYAAHRKMAAVPPSAVVMKKHNHSTDQSYILMPLSSFWGLLNP